MHAQRFWNLHVRTVLAILVWLAVALLILNIYLRSGCIFMVSIVLVVIVVVVYFIPSFVRTYTGILTRDLRRVKATS